MTFNKLLRRKLMTEENINTTNVAALNNVLSGHSKSAKKIYTFVLSSLNVRTQWGWCKKRKYKIKIIIKDIMTIFSNLSNRFSVI